MIRLVVLLLPLSVAGYRVPSASTRRLFGARVVSAGALLGGFARPSSAADDAGALKELRDSYSKLEPLAGLLDNQEWDNVRTVLKNPPVGLLWNLGESKNTLRKLALGAGDPELVELADDVAGALQLCDQYTYDNNFIYFQPGNGKVKIKEPKLALAEARRKLQEAIDVIAAAQ